MTNKPFYQKLYADMIRDKYPEKEAECLLILQKKDWNTLDVIRIDQILFGKQRPKETLHFNKKHRAYDIESIKFLIDYQKKNKLSNKEMANTYELSRNTLTKWKKIFDV